VAIRIIVYPLDDIGCPIWDEKVIHRIDRERITCGPEKSDDLFLEHTPDLRFSIYKSLDSDYFLERENAEISIQINKNKVDTNRIRLKNGDEIQIGTYLLFFEIEFSNVGQNDKIGLLAHFASVLMMTLTFFASGTSNMYFAKVVIF